MRNSFDSRKKAVVIGAGLGGLATAALLAKDNYQVTIFEKNDRIGGRAMVFKEKGFIFDSGPSWYLMPEVFERYFRIFRHRPEDFYKLKRLDPQYRVFFGNGEKIDIRSSLNKNLAMFENLEKGSSKGVVEYLSIAKTQYHSAMQNFVYRNYDSIFDFFDSNLMKAGKDMRIFQSLDGFISQYVKNEKIKKILLYTTVFLGGSPKNTPAMYAIMSYLDFYSGVYYPMGGFGAVVGAFEALCKQHEVEVLVNSAVEKIVTDNGRATGLVVNGKYFNADIVIANADYHFVESQLLSPKDRSYSEKYWTKKTLAPSAFIAYLGVKRKVKNLLHHNLMLANDWQVHFSEIFKNPVWPNDPSYYVCCPSKSDSSVAPSGKENIFILVPVASGLKLSEQKRREYSKKILELLKNEIEDDFTKDIEVQKTFSVPDYEETFNSFRGTALGLSHTFFQTAIFRPKNQSKKVKNLFFVGQFTTPGVGVPMVIISAQLTYERIRQSL